MRKWRVRNAGLSGNRRSTWNRKRWNPYSRSVQIRLPTRKQAKDRDQARDEIFSTASRDGMVDAGWLNENAGRGASNWMADRMKRYAAIGSQTIGTTYHAVLVKHSRYAGPKRRADSERCRGWWICCR